MPKVCEENARRMQRSWGWGWKRVTPWWQDKYQRERKALLSHQDGEGCKGWARTCMQHPEMYPTGSAKVLAGKVLSYFGSRRSNQSNLEETILNIHWKDWCWSWNSSTLSTWCGELTHLKRPWCWERLKVGGEGEDRGWDGWYHRLNGHEFE